MLRAAGSARRNQYRYWEVDDQRVLQIARNDLGDLEQFVGALSVHFNLGA